MALTNFAALTSDQLTAWSRDFWRVARNMSFEPVRWFGF